jgi:hypothetical protein
LVVKAGTLPRKVAGDPRTDPWESVTPLLGNARQVALPELLPVNVVVDVDGFPSAIFSQLFTYSLGIPFLRRNVV